MATNTFKRRVKLTFTRLISLNSIKTTARNKELFYSMNFEKGLNVPRTSAIDDLIYTSVQQFVL